MAEQQLSEEHGDDEPAPPAETIRARLDRTALAFPDREALVDVETGRRWTWSAPAADVDRPARGLRALVVRPGDRVAVWAANCPEWVLTQYATARLGAVLVSVDPAYRTREPAYVLRRAGVSVLVAQPSYRDGDHRAMAAEAATDCPALREAVWIGEPGRHRLLEEPERTAEAVDPDGWMHTGDLAVMRSDGYLAVVGRIKDVIIRGGENVYPREVEEFLHTHPAIADVQVVGVPDEHLGEEVCAFVVLRDPAAALDIEEPAAFCRGRLAHDKTPRYLRVVPGFPLTAGGKVRKTELRDLAARALAR
ncbi:AMP-binding protein [Kitasatospora sp. NPDC048365]|uniref:AMP-binding protein n=1 Tax=Kitasatospora sp. NPDC048365 TaxID=3364050 RepID=UPI00371A479C